MKKLIAEYLEEKPENIVKYETLNLRNCFNHLISYKNICFVYRTSGKIIMYTPVNPIQYNAIQRILAIKDRINTKGTKEYNKYHSYTTSTKENRQLIKEWYSKVWNIAFLGNYKNI